MSNQSTDRTQSVEKLLKYKIEIIVALIVICTGFFGAGAYLSNLWNKAENSNISIKEFKDAQERKMDEVRENQEKVFNEMKSDIKELKNELKETQHEFREFQKDYYKNRNNENRKL